jgi:hypothetical protein
MALCSVLAPCADKHAVSSNTTALILQGIEGVPHIHDGANPAAWVRTCINVVRLACLYRLLVHLTCFRLDGVYGP